MRTEKLLVYKIRSMFFHREIYFSHKLKMTQKNSNREGGLQFAWLIHLTFFLSGVAGLGYQIIWTRGFSLGLGHEMPSLIAILAAIFLGFALGSWGIQKVLQKTQNVAKLFVILELVAAIWSVLGTFLIPWANDFLGHVLGPAPGAFEHWAFSFSLPFLVLLPCTFAMGATLPVIDRLVSLHGTKERVSGLYAANTAGGAAGILLSIFFLMPVFGFNGSIYALAACDFLAAGLIAVGPARVFKRSAPVSHPPREAVSFSVPMALFLTGLLGIAYEIVGIRALTQIFQNTIYTYASALFVYLLGTAVGAALYQKFLSQTQKHGVVLSFLAIALSLSCSLGFFLLSVADQAYRRMRELNEGLLGAVISEVAVSAMVFALPTIFMGMSFGHLAGMMKASGRGVGTSFAINTLGGSLASPLFGLIILPFFGIELTLLFIAFCYLLLFQDLRRFYLPLGCIGLIAFLTTVRLSLLELDEEEEFVYYKEGVVATVAVLEEPGGDRRLKVNNLFIMGGTGANFIEKRMATLPALLHPDPQNALFLGLGPGVTFGTMASFPQIQADGVELIPEVVEALPLFAKANQDPTKQPNLKVYTADARRFAKTTDQRYDLIIGDLFQPARDGAGALYTQEHFEAIKERLSPMQDGKQGIFCQWLPYYQMDTETLKLISRTFLEVFPDAYLLMASYNVGTPTLGLIGGHEAVKFQPHFESPVFQELGARVLLRKILLRDELDFFATIFMSNDELHVFCKNASLNTDNRPVVTWQAPRLAYDNEKYQDSSRTAKRFGEILEEIKDLGGIGDQLFGGSDFSDEQMHKIGGMLTARDYYLLGKISETGANDDNPIDHYLLSIASADEFPPARLELRRIMDYFKDQDPALVQSIQEAIQHIDEEKRKNDSNEE